MAEFDPVSFLMGRQSVDPNAQYYTKAEIDVLLAQKQNVLTFDNTPTENSTNPVTSDGIYDAVNNVVKFASGNIGIGETSKTVSFSGEFVYAFAVCSNKEIVVDKTINVASVVFSLDEAIDSAVNCFVIYV